jgi:hypothetical protein
MARCTDGLAHTKDLLDSRFVVYYSLTFLYVRAEVPLPASLLQHTTGLAFVQCRVIHTGVVGERERACGILGHMSVGSHETRLA